MKTYTYALLLAAAATGLAVGQTAYTTPVGYVSLNVPAASDTTFTTPLARPSLLQAASTGVSGNVITVSATGAANDAFINTPADGNAKTYVLVRSGPLAGLRFPVADNDGTTVTVDGGATTLQAQGFVTGNTFSVVPYWTLATLFPGGAGVGGSADIYDPSATVLVSEQQSVGTNRSSAAAYFYSDGTSAPAGWLDANDPEGASQNNVAIDPSITHKIRSAAATKLTINGEVPSVALKTVLLTAAGANDEYVSSPYPVDVSLTESGLQSAIKPSPDIYDPVDTVLIYDDEASGFNKGSSAAYFYSDGTSGPVGWLDANDPEGDLVTGKVLKAGRAFTIRKAGGTPTSTTWTSPIPYTL